MRTYEKNTDKHTSAGQHELAKQHDNISNSNNIKKHDNIVQNANSKRDNNKGQNNNKGQSANAQQNNNIKQQEVPKGFLVRSIYQSSGKPLQTAIYDIAQKKAVHELGYDVLPRATMTANSSAKYEEAV